MLDIFNNKQLIIFTTREFATNSHLSLSAASRKLSRLRKENSIVNVTKGIWANNNHPYFHPLSCAPYLLNKEQGYVSFLTALHLHGLLSQIPKSIQIASTGHSRKLESVVGYFEFIQVKPELMQHGLIWSETQLPFLLATPEKAVFDVLYISTRKNRRFARLPELTLEGRMFSKSKFKYLLRQASLSKRILNAMRERAARELGVISD